MKNILLLLLIIKNYNFIIVIIYYHFHINFRIILHNSQVILKDLNVKIYFIKVISMKILTLLLKRLFRLLCLKIWILNFIFSHNNETK